MVSGSFIGWRIAPHITLLKECEWTMNSGVRKKRKSVETAKKRMGLHDCAGPSVHGFSEPA
jgi:hypothetical protein